MIAAAVAGGVVDRADAAILLVAVALSMMAIPSLGRLGAALARRRARELDPEALVAPPDEDAGRVIIVGYGRVGTLIGEMLEAHRIRFIAVDVDPNLTARERRAGKPVYYGDASREDFLRRCGLETARALVITLDKPSANEQVVAAARRLQARRHHHRPRARRGARAHALRARRQRRGAGNDRSEPAAFRGDAGRHRRADGAGDRLDPREARRIPQAARRRRRQRAHPRRAAAEEGLKLQSSNQS